MTPTVHDALATAALDYAARGWRVVPLADREKRPRIRDWVVNASNVAAQVEQWWRQWPKANVGVALGTGSGIVSVDLDSDAAEAKMFDLAGNEGVPDTLEVLTSPGCRRLLFSIPDSLDFEPETRSIPMAGGELRFQSTGAQCVMPPSIHPGDPKRNLPPGHVYAWAPGRSPAEMAAAPSPGWLIKAMEPKAENANPPATPSDDSIPNVKSPAGSTVPEIVARFNRDADWLNDILAPKGWKLDSTDAQGVLRVTRPGKSGGCSATIGHYKAEDGTPTLFVFSGSVAEFVPNKPVDKFGAYARLYHQGDTAVAIRALAATKRYGRLNAPPKTNGAVPATNGVVTPAISAAALARRVFDPPRFAVDGLLGEGLTVFAGKPKGGKSWLSLLMGWAIAGGQPINGRGVKQGHVLYLALEDTERRLQQRLFMLREGLGWEVPETLEFRTHSPRADQGGIAIINNWLVDRKGVARLVIIDTLGRFRKSQKGNGNSYSEDYDALAEIKSSLDLFGVSGIVVTHTRKLKAEDPFEEVSGTLAIGGAADSTWVLDRGRGSLEAKLYAIGRDQPESTTPLTFDSRYCLWHLGPTKDEIDVSGRALDPGTNKVEQCCAWLRAFLREYAYPSKEIEVAAKKAGFSFSALKEAKARLGRSGSQEMVNCNRGGDKDNDWWSGLGSTAGWRLRPVPMDDIPP